MTGTIQIGPPRDTTDYDAIAELVREYSGSLGFSLDYQGFEAELADLRAKYGPPGGALLLARVDGESAGTVALRQLEPGIGEMKRLYVRPDFRRERTESGNSIGRELAHRIVETARACGHRRLRLDTIGPQMEAAIKLYRTMGFTEIAPYYPSPVPGTVYMELVL
ncbi:MAG: GNAT family N-acetyltransferase [Reyranella sp.]|uniref:GNAT family N-acetyltransferase n=1 Tax=Reyranella sp. TaxID=1929291 RepID=UPI0012294CC6|nr:GNAT family N-acetyltransferase [Reyranella sp.]TAJ89126.1 MAG: GNAT family N-acetyltransferase [Reyranella sp.]TBR23902.1 MAG: GNAT family N-acetyltransferase [Reyranella sp.]